MLPIGLSCYYVNFLRCIMLSAFNGWGAVVMFRCSIWTILHTFLRWFHSDGLTPCLCSKHKYVTLFFIWNRRTVYITYKKKRPRISIHLCTSKVLAMLDVILCAISWYKASLSIIYTTKKVPLLESGLKQNTFMKVYNLWHKKVNISITCWFDLIIHLVVVRFTEFVHLG